MRRLLFAAGSLLALVACSGPVLSITLTPPNATLEPGETVRFEATVSGTADPTVTWSTTGGILYGSDSTATFVAPLEVGSYDITATSVVNGDIAATATVVVEAATPEARIVFLSDRSILLAAPGDQARLEVQVVGPDGLPVAGGQVTWSPADPTVATVAADGDRAAVVTAATADITFTTITASYDGLEAVATVLLAKPSPGTVLIGSDLVVNATESTLTLVRNAQTEALGVGQRLVSGDRAGVLVGITGITVGADEVVLETEPISLTEAFDELSVEVTSEPVTVTAQFLGGDRAAVTVTAANGSPVTQIVIDDVSCEAENGAPIALEVSGADVSLSAEVFAEIGLDIDLGGVEHFLLKAGTSVDLDATTGTIDFSSPVSGRSSCSLDLPPLPGPSLSLVVFTFSLAFTPVLGIEAEAFEANGSFELSGPQGSAEASLEGGIEYSAAGGWDTIGESNFSAEFSPFSAEAALDQPFRARVGPFGRVDFGLLVELGLLFFDIDLVDVRFAELKGFGFLELDLSGPIDEATSAYSGPAWDLGIGASGALKAEFEGAIPDLLDRLGITEVFGGSLGLAANGEPIELFSEETVLEDSPTVTVLASPGEVETGDAITLTASSDSDESGTAEFWASKDGSDDLLLVASGAFAANEAGASWTPTEAGEYDFFARLRVDSASASRAYASLNVATVTVTEAEEPPPDPPPGTGTGPLGEEGPWRGGILYASLGDCNATGFLLTAYVSEDNQGNLSGEVSARRFDGGEFPDDLDGFLGPISATLSGTRVGNAVSFTLSGGLQGSYQGMRFVPVDVPNIGGSFSGAAPCNDAFGPHTAGSLILVGTQVVIE